MMHIYSICLTKIRYWGCLLQWTCFKNQKVRVCLSEKQRCISSDKIHMLTTCNLLLVQSGANNKATQGSRKYYCSYIMIFRVQVLSTVPIDIPCRQVKSERAHAGSKVETLFQGLLLIEGPSHRAGSRTCHGRKKRKDQISRRKPEEHQQGEIRKSVWKNYIGFSQAL